MSVILDSTSKSLQFILGSSAATNQLTCVASWADITSGSMTPGSTESQSNDTTAVTIVGSPASSTQRQVKNIGIYNADTTSATVTVSYNNGSVLFTLVDIALQSGETLQFSENAWSVINNSGAIVQAYQSAPAGSAGGDLNGSYPNPTVAKINGITLPSGAPTTNQVLTATSSSATAWQTPSGGSGTLASDTDVSISSPSNDQVLTYNTSSSKWTNQGLPTASTSVSGIIQIDGTSTDIQPLGTQTAGSLGEAADAGHVHPMPRLDQVNNPTTSVSLNSQKITSLANGTAGTDAAAFGQIPTAGTGGGNYTAGNATVGGDLSGTLPNPTVAKVNGISVSGTPATGQVITATSGSAASWQTPTGGAALDTTATDIQPIGVQSAGSTGKAADAGHVHPLQPYQFHVKAYGAKGNGKVVTDAAMSSGSANLACTTSTPFVSGDVGKSVLVSTAKGSYVHLMSTISTYTDSGHVVLANNATATTGGSPGAIMYYGTDDTSAVQNAINAAVSYAAANDGYAEVIFDPIIYIIAGAFTIGGSTLGNAQLTLPIVSPTGRGIILALKGPSDETPLMHWNQLTPQANGTVLASTRTDGTNNSTYGPASIIGGPYYGYGGEPGLFSNALIKVSGLATLAPYNATMSGMDLFGILEADIDSYSAMTAAVVPSSSAPVPSLYSSNNISVQYTYGLRMPTTGNQVVCRVGKFSTEGYCYGLGVSEWTHGQDIHAMYCIGALGIYSHGVSMTHHALIDHCQAENCYNSMIQVDNGIKRILVTSFGVESTGGAYDPSSLIYGEVSYMDQGTSEGYTSSTFASGHGLNIVFINKMSTGGVIGPPSVPASGTAFFNYYYRNATVYLTSGGAAVSAIAVDSSTTGLTLGTSGTVMLRVPSGHSITLTYASTAPTWTWILD